MLTKIITSLVFIAFGIWCVDTAIETCTSEADCFDTLCDSRHVVMCSEFNTCRCEHNNGVPSTCTQNKECHNMDCTHHAHKTCVNDSCTCVNLHIHNVSCVSHPHHCQNLLCEDQSPSICRDGFCVCVVSQGNTIG